MVAEVYVMGENVQDFKSKSLFLEHLEKQRFHSQELLNTRKFYTVPLPTSQKSTELVQRLRGRSKLFKVFQLLIKSMSSSSYPLPCFPQQAWHWGIGI